MANQLVPFSFDQPANLPVHLQGFNSGISKDLMLGGVGRNRIGLKGSRFRLIVSGQEEAVIEQSWLDVIIVGAAPGVSRLYYEGSYDEDEKTRPACYSADGVTPGADVTHPQSIKCASCPQNQKGSKITADGTKTKACTYLKRLAVVLVGDDQHRLFQLDGKAMTIFGEGEPHQNKFTLNEYAKKLNIRGYDVAHLVTKLSFDINSSVPKLYFSPVRTITPDEAIWVQELVGGEEVKLITTISAITDTSDTASEAPAAAPTPAPAPQAAPAPAPQATKPVTVAAKPAVTIVKAVGVPAAKATPATGAGAAPAPQAQVEEVTDDSLDEFLKSLEG
jgi:hypothetical protein